MINLSVYTKWPLEFWLGLCWTCRSVWENWHLHTSGSSNLQVGHCCSTSWAFFNFSQQCFLVFTQRFTHLSLNYLYISSVFAVHPIEAVKFIGTSMIIFGLFVLSLMEKNVKISNYNCAFVFFLLQFCEFLLLFLKLWYLVHAHLRFLCSADKLIFLN